MRTGTRDGYFVAEWSGNAEDHGLRALLDRFPAIAEENYIAITSWDSGRFVPNEADRTEGWRLEGDVAYSPRVKSAAVLPLAGFDE